MWNHEQQRQWRRCQNLTDRFNWPFSWLRGISQAQSPHRQGLTGRFRDKRNAVESVIPSISGGILLRSVCLGYTRLDTSELSIPNCNLTILSIYCRMIYDTFATLMSSLTSCCVWPSGPTQKTLLTHYSIYFRKHFQHQHLLSAFAAYRHNYTYIYVCFTMWNIFSGDAH